MPPPPSFLTLKAILRVHTRDMPLRGVDLWPIAFRTEGYSVGGDSLRMLTSLGCGFRARVRGGGDAVPEGGRGGGGFCGAETL
jgi:hypothetical protein